MARVLVIDRDAALRTAIASALTSEGHEVETVGSGQAGLALARASDPDVVVFDLREDGIALCRSFRTDPIAGRAALCVLTAEVDEEWRIAAFEAGADDYLSKPHSMRELMLRVRALARRKSRPPPPDVLNLGRLRIDRAARRVELDGSELALTRREFDVLLFLTERAGRVQTRDALMTHVWGNDADDTSSGRVVDTTIKRLRQKLGDGGQPAIRTVRGVGYKLE